VLCNQIAAPERVAPVDASALWSGLKPRAVTM
jgi:hypothetical protein